MIKISKDTEEESKSVTAKVLAPQIGSSNKVLLEQDIDSRKFAILGEKQRAILGYFEFRGGAKHTYREPETNSGKKPQRRGNRFWDHIVDWELHTTPSTHGKRATQVIQALAAERGEGKEAFSVAHRPGWIGRNLTQRDWKEDAMKKGEAIPE